ncbi:prenyltransferase/squalene oxidase repeat-containing protein [Nocardioides sp.]|uniref:prenyltransferase/squalene oxidase repeat-containing protein n=1 Tax=Nocardioides sp. TaxID=35761 RepID=UPI00261AA061|nr:prenyltransferase/squalene oxidase repeat-containing protein [Nocardioides sp.]
MKKIVARRSAAALTGAALLGSALAVSTLTPATAAPASTPVPVPEAQAAAAWLASQVSASGLLTYQSYGSTYADTGLSIDTAMVLQALGTQTSTIATIGTGVAGATSYGAHSSYTDTWTDPDHPATIESTASNALAKKVVGLQVAAPAAAVLPALVSDLEGVTDAAGRISDGATRDGVADAGSNYENIFGQAFAARALINASSSEGSAALTYLLAQQCSDGWFAEGLAASGSAATCDAGTAAPSVGGTATAVVQLVGLKAKAGAQETAVTNAIAKAASWLATAQADNGSFGAGGTFVANANDTGLAGWALGLAGRSADAAQAATWIAAHQVQGIGVCTSAKLKADIGAIAYDDEALADGGTYGIDDVSRGQWLRSSGQSVAALAYLPATAPKLTTTTAYVAAGRATRVTVAGLRSAQQACVTGAKAAVKVSANGALTVTAPAGTATRTLTLSTVGGTTTAKLKVLGAATLKVTSTSKVKRGTKITVTIKRLAAGEKVTLKLAGKKIGTATATSSGKAVIKVKVAKKTSAGTKKLSVVGQFANRVGSTKIKVTR